MSSSSSSSGSASDPNPPEQSTLPFHLQRLTVAESVFKQFDELTRKNNAAVNAFILDKKTIPDFVREDVRWAVMVLPADIGRATPIIYLHWPYGIELHREAFKRYRDYLTNNVIQFEEYTLNGRFELRIPTPHFRLDIACPYTSTHLSPPDVVANAPVTPE